MLKFPMVFAKSCKTVELPFKKLALALLSVFPACQTVSKLYEVALFGKYWLFLYDPKPVFDCRKNPLHVEEPKSSMCSVTEKPINRHANSESLPLPTVVLLFLETTKTYMAFAVIAEPLTSCAPIHFDADLPVKIKHGLPLNALGSHCIVVGVVDPVIAIACNPYEDLSRHPDMSVATVFCVPSP